MVVIDFLFFNSSNDQVGSLSIQPDLGSTPSIYAQDIVLAAPLNVQFVTAFLTGSNREVDFQNMGFTAEVSAPRNVPDGGATAALFCLALGGVASARRFMVGS